MGQSTLLIRHGQRKGSGRQECEAQWLPWLEAGQLISRPSLKQDLDAAPPHSQGKGAEMIWE